jgi:hypothetical protein
MDSFPRLADQSREPARAWPPGGLDPPCGHFNHRKGPSFDIGGRERPRFGPPRWDRVIFFDHFARRTGEGVRGGAGQTVRKPPRLRQCKINLLRGNNLEAHSVGVGWWNRGRRQPPRRCHRIQRNAACSDSQSASGPSRPKRGIVLLSYSTCALVRIGAQGGANSIRVRVRVRLE